MRQFTPDLIDLIYRELTNIIAETNGIYIKETLELLLHNPQIKAHSNAKKSILEFKRLIAGHKDDEVDIKTLLDHPVSVAFFRFFRDFPKPFCEEHIHLTGSLDASFIYPRLQKLLKGKHKKLYEKKIKEIYGKEALPIKSEEQVDEMIRLKEGERFDRYLKILALAKFVLTNKKAHEQAAYHLASTLYKDYNVGLVRLKFTLSRQTAIKDEQIPGIDNLTEEDVVLGLYDGFKRFQKDVPEFKFFLSPSFRKELNFYDKKTYKSKEDSFLAQVNVILDLIKKHPFLREHMEEVDTVGDEKELYRKKHFNQLKKGLRKLQYSGFKIRSHHGETWKTLQKGVQAVDNAMNIWHVDTLEHGLSLGINPNYYFQRLYQKVLKLNQLSYPIDEGTAEYNEVDELIWEDFKVKEKLIKGVPLNKDEIQEFTKTKFYSAQEVEHYQHDVLNRMINKKIGLVALPSSNMKLTGHFSHYKIHPFTWWEKKGVQLGIGTDNYITLRTNYIQELLILLYSDPQNLKIMKLLMVATKENRRPYISNLLWIMRKIVNQDS
jgi:adenosine deaminase